jgi:hypothetical protein
MDVGAGLIRTVQAAITLGAMVAARDSYPGFESVFGLTAGKHRGNRELVNCSLRFMSSSLDLKKGKALLK